MAAEGDPRACAAESRLRDLEARYRELERTAAASEAQLRAEVERLRETTVDDGSERSYREAIFALRQQVLRMRTPGDLTTVVDVVGLCMDSACVDYHAYGLNLVDTQEHEQKLTQSLRLATGAHITHAKSLRADSPVRQFWAGGDLVYRRDLLVDDPYGELDSWARAAPPAPRRAIIDVPFSHGTLAINSLRPNAFSDAEVDFFRTLAEVLTEAMQRWSDLEGLERSHAELARQLEAGRRQFEAMAEAKAQLEEKERLLTAFHSTAQALLGTVDLDAILHTLAEHVIRVGLFRSLMVALVDEDEAELRIVGNYRRRPTPEGGWESVEFLAQYPSVTHRLDDPDELAVSAARAGTMLVVEGTDERLQRDRDRGVVKAADVFYFLPIRHAGRTVAVLATGSPGAEREAILRRIQILRPFFDQVAIALFHARLYGHLQTRERQLREAQKMEVMGELTAGIAHNFNNLLQAVMGNLELALEVDDATGRPYLENAMRVAGAQADLVRQLMVYSRRGLQIDGRGVDLAVVVAAVESICRGTFDRRIEILCAAEPGGPVVLGDPTQLEQVLLNLCLNARDAVEGEEIGSPRVSVSLRAAESAGRSGVELRVSDNGVGMPRAVRERIFDPFYTTKPVDKGTGLGLSIVQGIVDLHGGEVHCESERGSGTTFRVWLPEAPDMEVEPVVCPPQAAAAHGRESLLLVEDEEAVRSAVAHALGRLGYRVLQAADGEEGLAVLEAEDYRVDLILLDLSMPRMSGPEMLAHAESDRLPPVVLFTGYVAPEQRLRQGYAAILEKPLMPSAVANCVRRILDEAQG